MQIPIKIGFKLVRIEYIRVFEKFDKLIILYRKNTGTGSKIPTRTVLGLAKDKEKIKKSLKKYRKKVYKKHT